MTVASGYSPGSGMGIVMLGTTGGCGNFYMWIGAAGNFYCGVQCNGGGSDQPLETFNVVAVASTTYKLRCEYDPV